MDKHIVMYSRTLGCPYISIAKNMLSEYNISFREIYIDKDCKARQYVLDWTGFLSVPTLVIASHDKDTPFMTPSILKPGKSPRGINRGSIITEATHEQLVHWLEQHGFIGR